MKFLVINRMSAAHGHPTDPGNLTSFADNLERLKQEGAVEAAWTFIAGGSAYVVEADDSATLLQKVRGNPFFATSDTEVIPVVDSVEHYRNLAKFRATHGKTY